jgi:hypothetical protein
VNELSIRTQVARAEHGEHRFRGYRLFADLLGNDGVGSLLSLAVGGRRLDPSEVRLLDDLAVVLAVADPRIGPLKVTRLVSSFGGIMAGYAAGNLCIEGPGVIGPWVAYPAAAFLQEVERALEGTATPAEVEAALMSVAGPGKRLPGYGVAFRPEDERHVELIRRVALAGRAQGRYWRLQEELSAFVRRVRRLEPNVGVGAGAALLDMGFSALQAGLVTVFLTELTFFANAVESADGSSTLLRELPPGSVKYEGPASRVSPRALAAVRSGS